MRITSILLALWLGAAAPAAAQPQRLTIADAITRALDYNLGLLVSEQGIDAARAERMITMSRLWPNVSGSISESRRTTNLEAFGFPLSPTFPRKVGPFNVFDARLSLSSSVFDLSGMSEATAAAHRVAAAQLSNRSTRDLVVLATANLYLQALASEARAAAAAAQLASSEAIHGQALNLRQGGIISGLDVVRAEVRMTADRQRATAATNDAEKAKLQLARIIGLPIGQLFTLADAIPSVPDPSVTFEAALARAYASRPDFLAAQEQLKALEAARHAVSVDRLPSVRVLADYGAIGLTIGSALSTFNITGLVEVPIFEGGRAQGRLLQADASLRRQQAVVEDMRAEIYYDVRSAFLDLDATQQSLQTAGRARDLANQQLTQSRDRFAAGVASNIEVVQAQEAVAVATEQFISATYGFNLAKAMLAQSIGAAEDTVRQLLGRPTP